MSATIKLKREGVKRVYSGKDGRCCCGCAGKYTDRGAPAFERNLGKLADLIEKTPAEQLDVGPNYIAVVVGSRLRIAYFD